MSDVKLYTFDGAAGCYVYEGDYKKLKAENESLRKDAERYAHLKKEWQDDFLIGYLDSNVHPSSWDEVIDARINRSQETP